jgi:CheY-like chemotaxis protein
METNDPIIEQAANIIDRQVVQLVRLVDDLLDITRITKGKLRLTSEPVELRLVATRAAETVRSVMDARKHDFSMSLPTQPVWVNGDPARLEQVIVNLLNNAAKYTDVAGLVRMSIEQQGADAVIRVKDNGVGIPPEMLPQIFNLFTQVDGTLGRSYGGLGIGLALVKTLVEMQDGRVQVQSAGLGKGSEFTIKLPIAPASATMKARTSIKTTERAANPLQILVVEDNVDSADSLSLLLRLHGLDVQIARSGPTALEMVGSYHPDVVLLDIGLPGMDGYQVAQRLREMPEFKNIIICAVTGYTPSEADRQRQQHTGFNHHFIKPVNLKTLLDLFKTITPQV